MKLYKIKYKENNEIKSIKIRTSSLKDENLPFNIISINETSDFMLESFFSNTSIKEKDLNLIFYELSMMLDSGINLNIALDVLIKNKKNLDIQKFLKKFKNALINKDNLNSIFEDYNTSHLTKSFWQLILKSGDITSNIHALNSLIKENENLKKVLKKALTYPMILLISFFISLTSIFLFVIPKFKNLFLEYNTTLPLSTKILLNIENFFQSYFIYLLVFVLFSFLILVYFYKFNYVFRYKIDKFLFLTFFKNFEIYKVFLVIDIMQKNNYEFHKALSSSKLIIKNKYFFEKISFIEKYLENGQSISSSFLKVCVFDDMVLNLLNTAEFSNCLDKTISEIKKIYKNRFDERINFLLSLIEPTFLVIIMLLITWIVLAVFQPIWNMQNLISI